MLKFADPATHARFLRDSARTWAELWGSDADAVNVLLLGHPDHPVAEYAIAYTAALRRVLQRWTGFYVAGPERPGLENTTAYDALAGALFLVELDAPDALPGALLDHWRAVAQKAARHTLEADESPYAGPVKRSHHKRPPSPPWPKTSPLPPVDALPAAEPDPEERPDPVADVEALRALATAGQRAVLDAFLDLAQD